MILVDSSVWMDHIRRNDSGLIRLLETDAVLLHPFIIGEIAMGSMANRLAVIHELSKLPQIPMAQHEEVMKFVASHRLFGLGIGYIDAHLLASVRITPAALLWTRDRRLHEAANKLSLAFTP
jgi:predicted nucleic acid-binding protein